MRASLTLWSAVAVCVTVATPPLPSGFHLPAFTHVQRNWFAMPSDPVGTVVTRVHRDESDNSVVYTLRSSDPPVPFQIDPATGIVTVNDTLRDKENKTYSLWVIADDGSIPQTTEVIATITDQTGQTPRLPRPPNPFPPWGTTSNINFNFSSNLPPLPKPVTTTPRTTTTTKDAVTTEATTKRQPSKPEDAPRSEDKGKGDKNTSNVSGAPDKEQSSFPLVVIPLVVVTALAAVVAAVIVFVCKKNIESKKNSKKEEMAKESNGIVLSDASLNIWERQRAYSNRYEAWDNAHLQLSDETSITEKVHPSDEWEFPRHRLRIFNIVGEGAFGQVWRACAIDIDGKKGEQTVAVKTLKENASEKEKHDLIQELIVMKGLGSHPNVVRLVGCCTDKEPTLVIMEFVSLGKLQQFLRDSRAERHYGNVHGGSKFLTSRDLTHFAFQVARGMEFLSSKGIIHRDLAARNVLITEERTCKVADFGFARDVGGDHVYERKSDGRLPIRWMAPESLYDDIFSVKSDIWSFGVLLWEIVTLGSTPYPGLSAGDVMKKVREGHRLEKPEHCRRELYNIMYYCWEGEAASRPDFEECVTMLERLLGTETDYIELERFPDHSYYNLQQVDGEKV